MQHLPSPAVGGRIERLARQLLLLAAFSIPFSTALTNIFAGLTLIAFVPALLADRSLARPLASPAALLALALLALVLVGGTWSIAPPHEVSMGMRKYAKLLLLPVAICLCWRAPGLPARVLRWSLAGSAVLATSLYLVWIDMMPTSSLGWWRVGDASDPFAFRNHITAGILLSFAACACLPAGDARGAHARTLGLACGGRVFRRAYPDGQWPHRLCRPVHRPVRTLPAARSRDPAAQRPGRRAHLDPVRRRVSRFAEPQAAHGPAGDGGGGRQSRRRPTACARAI